MSDDADTMPPAAEMDSELRHLATTLLRDPSPHIRLVAIMGYRQADMAQDLGEFRNALRGIEETLADHERRLNHLAARLAAVGTPSQNGTGPD